MPSTPEPIVQPLHHEFQHWRADVTGPEARAQTADTVEWPLFRRLLALGAARLRLFLVTRAAGRPAAPVTAPDGTRRTSHEQRPTTYFSGFGKVRLWRQFFPAPGPVGLGPLDAELSLPARCYADLLREWAVSGTTDASYRASQTVLGRILGLSRSVHAREAWVTEAGAAVTTFSEQPAAPTAPVPAGTSLVVHADGNGVPRVQPPTRRPPVRLGKGQKRGTTKEAVVTGLYTRAPYPRTPQAVVGALLQEPGCPAPRLRPEGQALRATLEGKARAMRRLVQRVAPRAGPAIQRRVALTDGAEALHQPVVSHLPAYTLVLDSIHATEYLWDTATALRGETHPQRVAWVREYLEALLAGQTDAVIVASEAEGKAPPGRGCHGRRCGGRWATPNAPGRTGTTTTIWRVGGRSGPAWWQAPVGSW